MIIVKTLDEFQTFIDFTKQQNIPYSIIGCETEGYEGFGSLDNSPKPNKFYGKFALLCPSFNVYVYVKTSIDEKNTITDISSTFNFTEFKHLSTKSGDLYCHN